GVALDPRGLLAEREPGPKRAVLQHGDRHDTHVSRRRVEGLDALVDVGTGAGGIQITREQRHEERPEVAHVEPLLMQRKAERAKERRPRAQLPRFLPRAELPPDLVIHARHSPRHTQRPNPTPPSTIRTTTSRSRTTSATP